MYDDMDFSEDDRDKDLKQLMEEITQLQEFKAKDPAATGGQNFFKPPSGASSMGPQSEAAKVAAEGPPPSSAQSNMGGMIQGFMQTSGAGGMMGSGGGDMFSSGAAGGTAADLASDVGRVSAAEVTPSMSDMASTPSSEPSLGFDSKLDLGAYGAEPAGQAYVPDSSGFNLGMDTKLDQPNYGDYFGKGTPTGTVGSNPKTAKMLAELVKDRRKPGQAGRNIGRVAGIIFRLMYG